jgi:hypothetical protein
MAKFLTLVDGRQTLQDTLVATDQPIGSPEGLGLTWVSTSQITIDAGRAVIVSGSRAIAVLGSALTKSMSSTWVAGTSQGGRFAGTVSSNQTWHVFIIRNTATGAIDAGFDLSVTGANIPVGWAGRIIGSVMIAVGSDIRGFVQTGDRFDWIGVSLDFNGATPTSTTNLQTLYVPLGIKAVAFGRLNIITAGGTLYASPPGIGSDVLSTVAGHFMPFQITTNTSRQIIYYASPGGISSQIGTRGFYHPRGAY